MEKAMEDEEESYEEEEQIKKIVAFVIFGNLQKKLNIF